MNRPAHNRTQRRTPDAFTEWDAYHSEYGYTQRAKTALWASIAAASTFWNILFLIDSAKAKAAWYFFIILVPVIITLFYWITPKRGSTSKKG